MAPRARTGCRIGGWATGCRWRAGSARAAVLGRTLLIAGCGAGGGGGTGTTNNQAAYSAALKFSNCMRSHDVPNLPDPIFPAFGGAMIGAPPASFDPGALAFRRAAAACGRPFNDGTSAVKRAGG